MAERLDLPVEVDPLLADPGGLGPALAADRGGEGAGASMTSQVVRGASWSGLSRLITQGLQFVVGLVLARLLLPADFGLLASIYVITGFAVLFFELGLGSSLVQLSAPTERDLSTVFWVNALGGVVFAGLLTLAAPLVADFYGQPELRTLTPVVALSFTAAVGVVHNALLQRAMRFGACARIEVTAAVLGSGVTVGAALLGAGAMSLALGPVVASVATSVGSWCSVRWYPRHFISRRSLRRLWGFSGGMLGSNVVNYWGRNADNLVIGRFLGASPLGLYNRAFNLMLLPVTQITGALGRVMFPALAAMQDDAPRVRRAYLRTLRVINVLTIPFLVGLAAVAEGLVPLLWGPGWRGTVPLLIVLCIGGVPQCMGVSVGWIYQSQGRTTTMFHMSVVGTAVMGVSMAVGLHWGLQGVAWAVLVKSWVMLPISLHVAGRIIDLPARTVLRQGTTTLVSAAVMGVSVWLLPLALGVSRGAAWVVLLQVVSGVLVYTGALRLLAPSLFAETVALVRTRGRG